MRTRVQSARTQQPEVYLLAPGLAAFHRFPAPTSDVFRACVPHGRSRNVGVPEVGARNEFNSAVLRNWLRLHSSGKFLIVCPATSP